MDELHFEELSLRAAQEKMDDAFRTAMRRAIKAGGTEIGAILFRPHAPERPGLNPRRREAGF